ncbi:TIGR00366 family protein [uncultured Bilophila sp.]|uniref:short-chain fatty acid transporter n=1 Tax=uncultured Bilophila sp. TaxID=529385 RepID=UPI00280A818D|nr:TIGR00366 family protein [uncultured Bilophila sp.]
MDKLTIFFTELMRKYLPEPFVFALSLTFLTMILAILIEGCGFVDVVNSWGKGFWGLLAFTTQMAVILAMGYVLATAPFTERLLDAITGMAHTPRQAVIAATLVGGIGSYLNWGFGLVIGGIIAKKIALNLRAKGVKVHYPLIIASAYSGFTLYGLGLSASIPVLVSTPGHPMEHQMGVVPLSETIFSPAMLAVTLIVLITLPLLNAALHPKEESKIIEVDPNVDAEAKKAPSMNLETTLASKVNNSRILSLVACALAAVYVVDYFASGRSLDLNLVNFVILFLGILLLGSPISYVNKLSEGIRTIPGIILQYPFYAGIMAIMDHSGLVVSISRLFTDVATAETLPFFGLVSSFFINFFAPSAGGHWVIQGPFMMDAAIALKSSLAHNAMAVMLGNAWNDLVQPFWILPALAISRLKLKDIMGYTVVMMFWIGAIYMTAVLLWGYLGH